MVARKFRQNKLIEEQTKMVRWTKWLAIATVILAIFSFMSSIAAVYMALVQTPRPQLLLDVKSNGMLCSNNMAFPNPLFIKIANVGSRTSIDTVLEISYDEKLSFFDAYFVKVERVENRTNPNVPSDWIYPKQGVVIGYPYWVAEEYKTYIYLEEIQPGEIVYMVVRINGECSRTKTVRFELTEKGYSSSSGVKTANAIWK